MDSLAHAWQPSQREEAQFFVSYCRDDLDYVERLTAHLADHGIPLWLDQRMEWGVQAFPQEIRRRLTTALAVIVVMSPRSENSRWVENEVLEGQRYNRDFFPVLLAGERFFLLARTNYFDARDGSLPGEPELRQLRQIRDAGIWGTGRPAPPIELPAPVRVPTAMTARYSTDDSIRRLRAYLAEDEIAHADILTTSILLSAASRLEAGWLHRRDGRRLPPDLLNAVDAAWSEFSGGTQGFRTQLGLYPAWSGRGPAGHGRDFAKLARALGWTRGLSDTTPKYAGFVRPSGPPDGFFPTLRNPQLERFDRWYEPWLITVMAVHLQLRQWASLT
jgi:TIR domain/GUN4-like